MKRVLILSLLMFLSIPNSARAEDATYNVYQQDGQPLFEIQESVSADDEYISGDNGLYKIVSVDESKHTAQAQYIGQETMDEWAQNAADTLPVLSSNGGDKLIALYSTHSDESYIPGDGASSKMSGAGIYDVDEALKTALEDVGISVVLDKTTHLPHDAGAYRRSRSTAEELMKQRPAALIDLHRDGIPDPASYTTTVDGEDASKVRLLVGRSNPNASANRAFAKRIKSVADKRYPGLIKDIFIGKGNYNQELMPKSILLEFGTYTMEKERAIESTKYMADVLSETLFGVTAKAAQSGVSDANAAPGAGAGIIWLIIIAVIAVVVFAALNASSASGAWNNVKRGASEMTGGLIGKKPKE